MFGAPNRRKSPRRMPGRRKTGKCLSVGECCLKLMLTCKGSAVDSIVSRCVQTFSSGIVVNTKMFTEKRCKSSNQFFLSESYQSNSCLFKLGSSFFFKYRSCKHDIRGNPRAMMKLMNSADIAKHSLSTLGSANCFVDSLYDGLDFDCNVSR